MYVYILYITFKRRMTSFKFSPFNKSCSYVYATVCDQTNDK
ncbi:unnamed protein product [Larinioides sclopetarius]|uniref:Uncharacterized protein n=1 Tax=Larinioides sclopetarius TaxID=280406 RepID=A0AAV1Z0R3_9ARAC